jgi:hypothetical protein
LIIFPTVLYYSFCEYTQQQLTSFLFRFYRTGGTGGQLVKRAPVVVN